MIIFGAVDFTAALVRAGKLLGYRVTVCDAREVFATPARFPMADEVVNDWPDRYLAKVADTLGPRDAVCVLTHDAKFDVPAIVAALETRVGYLGAMGCRRTHAERVERLREAGVDEAGLDRVMAPIGLDIGARTPEETAIAVCAEIIARRTGRPAPLPARRTRPDPSAPRTQRLTMPEADVAADAPGADRPEPHLVVRLAVRAALPLAALRPRRPDGGVVLLAVLGATDWVDGWIARRFDQGSDLGKVLDPDGRPHPAAHRRGRAARSTAASRRGSGSLVLAREAVVERRDARARRGRARGASTCSGSARRARSR